MKVRDEWFTSIWHEEDSGRIFYIDQTRLPEEFVIREMKTFEDGLRAIKEMEVRGAPLIGVAAAYALSLTPWSPLQPQVGEGKWGEALLATRPTAVNLRYAIEYMTHPNSLFTTHYSLLQRASAFRQEELERSQRIGENGLAIIREIWERKGGVVNIMTHCNAGWLATVDWGTALAPVYRAEQEGIPVHVWVSETRPRNQGSKLTAWELSQHGIPCTVVVDNACGYLMRQGEVDLVIVGADRIARNGETANKVGTYLKALAARDNRIPFYVAAPLSTFDPSLETGEGIPIEERSAREIDPAIDPDTPNPNPAYRNPAFDVTPTGLITGFITDNLESF